MAYKIIDCPATFDFELSDGTVHSMPVPAGLSVDEALKLEHELSAAKGDVTAVAKVYDQLIHDHCPELAGVELTTYVVMQISAAWIKASPIAGESSASRN